MVMKSLYLQLETYSFALIKSCTYQLCSLYLQLALTFMVRPEALISIPEGLATRDDVGMASPLSLILHQVSPNNH